MRVTYALLFCFLFSTPKVQAARSIVATDTKTDVGVTLQVSGVPHHFPLQNAIVRPDWPGLYLFGRDGQVLVAEPSAHTGYGKEWYVEKSLTWASDYTENVLDVLMYPRVTYTVQTVRTFATTEYLVSAIETNTGRLMGFHRFPRKVSFFGYGNIAVAVVRAGKPGLPSSEPRGREFHYELNSLASLEQRWPLVNEGSPYAVVHTQNWLVRAGLACADVLGLR